MMEEKAKSWVCRQLVQKPKGNTAIEMLGHLTSVSVEVMICIKICIMICKMICVSPTLGVSSEVLWANGCCCPMAEAKTPVILVGGMAQQSKVHVTFAEDYRLIPRTLIRHLTNTYKTSAFSI